MYNGENIVSKQKQEDIFMQKKIKVGLIGLGQRGDIWVKAILKNFTDDLEIVALCDVYEDRVETCAKAVEDAKQGEPKKYLSAHDLFRDPSVEAVIISASWEDHIPLAIESMNAGKITALEVGGAYSIDDCWQLVRTYEKTKVPFFFMENCCYGKKELLATNMVRKGLLGEVVYCHGAYCHDLRSEIAYGVKNRHYRLRNYLTRDCDNYPTHELGPIAKLLSINRGNRMLSLVSVSSKPRGLANFVQGKEDLKDLHDQDFRQGDVVETLIKCADGSLISLKLDTTLPHAYSREFSVSGTKGCYQEVGDIALIDGADFNHENDVNEYLGSAKQYEKDYLPKIWQEITEEQLKGGHGGMDDLMLRSFIDAIRSGKEMPIDVYDAACWMAITCLSEESIAQGGATIAIPDFTGGQWVMRQKKDVIDL